MATLQIQNRQVPPELRRVILSEKSVVFIGSGPSVDIYGRWHEVVNKLCERCGSPRRVDEDSREDDLLAAASDAKQADSSAYFAYLGEHFGRPVDGASFTYDVVLSLPFSCYLTVNFDPSLALKAKYARVPCNLPVCSYPSLDRLKMTPRTVHYLHGYIGVGVTPVEGTVVLAKDEFDKAYDSNSNLMNLLVPTLENDPVVFIGCRLREPAMAQVFRICKEHQENRQRVMAETGRRESNPPPKYILLPRPEVRDAQGELDADKSEEEMNKQDAYYRGLEVKPVWYDAPRKDHFALRCALEQLAKLPDVTPDYGWQGGRNAPR